jgi:hypothetical protein
MGKLHTVIHKNESYKLKMQRDLIVILRDNRVQRLVKTLFLICITMNTMGMTHLKITLEQNCSTELFLPSNFPTNINLILLHIFELLLKYTISYSFKLFLCTPCK